MPTAYEIRLIFGWLANAVDRLSPTSHAREGVAEWLEEHAEALGVPFEPADDAPTHSRRRWRGASANWRNVRAAVRHGRNATAQVRRDRTAARLQRLANVLGLSTTDVALVETMLRYDTQPVVEDLFDRLSGPAGAEQRSTPAVVCSRTCSAFLRRGCCGGWPRTVR